MAEVIGFIALLDGHPRIQGQPTIAEARAAFQQTKGTTKNPLAHAIPSDLLLDGNSLLDLYRSAEARKALQRVFGMGVMAPTNWEDQNAFQFDPRQNNVVDSVAERHQFGGGLVDAFKAAGEVAVSKGRWDGSGKRRHDLTSLTKFVADIYADTWVPRARSAYSTARTHFSLQIAVARKTNPSRVKLFEQRRDILDAQIGVFQSETSASPEAVRNVWKFAATEVWTEPARA